MDHLPHDPAILVSAINMQLRDEEFSSLAELCYAFGTDPATVEHYLDEHGYIYNKVQKQFKERYPLPRATRGPSPKWGGLVSIDGNNRRG